MLEGEEKEHEPVSREVPSCFQAGSCPVGSNEVPLQGPVNKIPGLSPGLPGAD